ncbi:MAG: hypothetical protein GY862_06285 [Gammaproteobacteria bacterium]|nr:hypothetical protein [Gammaproteobacteria bacterium]
MRTCSHCLRPAFTRRILHALLSGASLNLIGGEGSGRRHLLDDIKGALPDNALLLYADLRQYRHSQAALAEELHRQLRHAGLAGNAGSGLGAVLERLESREGRALLLLHHFDALLNNPELGTDYSPRFIDSLNSIRNHPQMGLLCVTPKPQAGYAVFLEGKRHANSWLDLQLEHLPALDEDEIRAEFKRRFPPLKDAHLLPFLINSVQKHAHDYDLLDFIGRKIANREDHKLPLDKRLKKWQRQFDDIPGAINLGKAHRLLRGFNAWLSVIRDFLLRITLLGRLWEKFFVRNRKQ